MIPSWREIVYSVYGAWRLFRLDRGGMTYFDDSVEGFWKSFFAAVLMAPAYVLVLALHLSKLTLAAGLFRIVVVQLLAYVINWTAFPVVAYQITQNMGRGNRYRAYIVAFNWAKIIQIGFEVSVLLLITSGLLPESLNGLLNAVLIVVVLGYEWFVTRTALDVSGLQAIGLVVLNFLLGILIISLADARLL